jgi:hypothetical protein
MLSARTALVLLATGILLGGCAGGTQVGEPRSRAPVDVQSSSVPALLMGKAVLAPPLRQATAIVKLKPWRYRLKTVLDQTDHRVIEETDLGPTPLPSRLHSHSSLELVDRHRSVCTPLRC